MSHFRQAMSKASAKLQLPALTAALILIMLFYYWLGQDWPMEWGDEAHFSAVTDSLLRGDFPGVPELSAEKGIYWMPFFSNLYQAIVFKLSGVNSVYSRYVIRPYIVLPLVAGIYICLYMLIKGVTRSDYAAISLVTLFLLLPSSAGPLNTVRQEGLCIFLISLLAFLWTRRNVISSLAVAAIILLTHPLAGLVALISTALFICWDLASACSRGFMILLSPHELLAYLRSYVENSFRHDKHKYLFIAVLSVAIFINLYAVLWSQDGLSRLHEHLEYQAVRKAGRDIFSPLAGLKRQMLLLGSSIACFYVLFDSIPRGPERSSFQTSNYCRSVVGCVILGATLIFVPATLGHEMWYSVYGTLGVLLLTSALAGIGMFLLSRAGTYPFAAPLRSLSQSGRSSIKSLATGLISLGLVLIVLTGLLLNFRVYSFSGMDLASRLNIAKRHEVAKQLALQIGGTREVIQADPHLFRILQSELRHINGRPRLVNIPGVIKDSPFSGAPIVILAGPYPQWLYEYGWDNSSPRGYGYGKDCHIAAKAENINGYICR